MSFIPQMLLSVGSGFALPSDKADLPFTWFVQTVAFVAFNKVCTSQVIINLQFDLLFLAHCPTVFPLVHVVPTTHFTPTHDPSFGGNRLYRYLRLESGEYHKGASALDSTVD